MDKALLRQSVIAQLRAERDLRTRAALLAHDEATHEESKPENKYDMHAQEAAYLAEGQARLAAELDGGIAQWQNTPLPAFAPAQPIALGAVVTVEAARRQTRYFIGPCNGGMEIECAGESIMVITPQSPLGRLLLGRRAGDIIPSPQSAGRSGPLRILAVA
jgi:transcription elongation GreA/GreB family factor